MARCIKCERCTSVCPTGIIEPLGVEGGLLQARTPTLSFVNDSCTFCDLCRQVCPTGAIDAVDAWAPDQGRIGCAILHEDRCLAFLETNSCGICVDACPYEALSFDAGRRPGGGRNRVQRLRRVREDMPRERVHLVQRRQGARHRSGDRNDVPIKE